MSPKNERTRRIEDDLRRQLVDEKIKAVSVEDAKPLKITLVTQTHKTVIVTELSEYLPIISRIELGFGDDTEEE